MPKETKKRKCYNCIHAGKQFKIGNLSHLHCNEPHIQHERELGLYVSPWDTLRVFSDSCVIHEFKKDA